MDQPTRLRAGSRSFSFRSDKSGGSRGKVDLTESPEDKARRDSIWKATSKANPNAAITEAQPGVRNLTEQSTLGSLRNGTHKDVQGNPIVDPDLSNPTRPRLERPLDTIRSFEKAIDDGYKRRSTYMSSESYDQQNQNSRRSSYFSGEYTSSYSPRKSVTNAPFAGYDANTPSPGRHSAVGGGYYGDRRSDSYYGGGGPNGGPQRQRYGQRMQGDSGVYSNGGPQRPYSHYGYHQSMDTMQTGMTNGSDSTGPWPNSTDPSSENSSIDKNIAGRHQQESYGQQQNAYGSYGSPPIMEEGDAAYGGPVQPPHRQRRAPIPLGNSRNAPPPSGQLPRAVRAEPEKKKGRLSRMFSKKAKD